MSNSSVTMRLAKSLGKSLYIQFSKRRRERLVNSLKRSGRMPTAILFYHRVADDTLNDWTISRRGFLRHLDWLEENFDLVGLEEAQTRILSPHNSRPTVAITFDDGYSENCDFAIPELCRRNIPVTYFVSTESVKTGKPFMHDVKTGFPLVPNTIEEIKDIASRGAEIGAHSKTHSNLGLIEDLDQLRDEIVGSARELEQWIKKPIRYFSFPFGLPENMSQAAVDIIAEAGFRGFCSAYGAWNWPSNSAFHLRRIHADPDLASLQNWLTLDPRKLRDYRKLPFNEKYIAPAPASPLASSTTSSCETLTSADAEAYANSIQFEAKATNISKNTKAGAQQGNSSFRQTPLRVAFVMTSMPVGGAETLLVNLVRRMNRRNFAPEVICTKERGSLGEILAQEMPVHSGLYRQAWDLRIAKRMKKLIRTRQYDAVITVGCGDKMFWGRLAAWRCGVPVICSALHSTGWPDGIGFLNRQLTSITDGFIAVADNHAKYLIEKEQFPGERVFTIPNGVDVDRFRPNHTKRTWLRQELGLPASAPLVGIVAALRPEKNHLMFVDVANEVLPKHPDTHFVIVGDGTERVNIEQKIRDKGLTKQIHLLGNRSDTENILAGLDIFTLTSLNEANPVSILESLSTGIPVVSTRVGSIHETVIHEKTGLLTQPSSIEQSANAICRLLSNPKWARELGLRGREHIRASWGLDAMVRGYEKLIETLYNAKAITKQRLPWKPMELDDHSHLDQESVACLDSLQEICDQASNLVGATAQVSSGPRKIQS